VTTDLELSVKKRGVEQHVHRVHPKEFFQTIIRFQSDYAQTVLKQHENNENISLKYDFKTRSLYIEGRYENVCELRATILEDFQSNGKNGTSVRLSNVQEYGEDLLQDLKQLSDGGEVPGKLPQVEFILSLFGDITQRNRVLEVLCHKYTPAIPSKTIDVTRTPIMSDESIMFSTNITESEIEETIELHLMAGISRVLSNNDINTVAKRYDVEVLTSFFEVKDFRSQQLSVQGKRNNVYKALVELDKLCMAQSKNVWELMISPEIVEKFHTKWKSIFNYLMEHYKIDDLYFNTDTHAIRVEASKEELKKILADLDYQIYLFEYQCSSSPRRHMQDTREHLKSLDLCEYGVGGLSKEFNVLLRRTFQSRMVSQALKKELGLVHCKGVIFHGPTGTGKSLIAKHIANILGCSNPKFIHSPEIESKWVGESEKNLRDIFADAQADYDNRWRQAPPLHIVIFDEIDAITRERGGHNAKARDGALHQLLCELDGMKEIDNILVFGLTNRLEDLDSAVLRPGRFEVHLEINLPDAEGREEIFLIHTASMRKFGRLDSNIDFGILSDVTDGFSGADIASCVRVAQGFALERMQSEEDCMISLEDMEKAIVEVRSEKLVLKAKKDNVPVIEGGPEVC